MSIAAKDQQSLGGNSMNEPKIINTLLYLVAILVGLYSGWMFMEKNYLVGFVYLILMIGLVLVIMSDNGW